MPDHEGLKPCPFCGQSDTLYFLSNGIGSHSVGCNCGGEGPLGEDESEAAALWNRRAPVAGERTSTGAGTSRDAGDALGVAKVEQGR